MSQSSSLNRAAHALIVAGAALQAACTQEFSGAQFGSDNGIAWFESGDDQLMAVAEGTLAITRDCVTLESETGETHLLVFPRGAATREGDAALGYSGKTLETGEAFSPVGGELVLGDTPLSEFADRCGVERGWLVFERSAD